jgi:hypothetical protein
MPEADCTVRWAEVVGFPGYWVGTNGEVWSQWTFGRYPKIGKWHQLKVRITRAGYRRVSFHRNIKRFCCRLVLEAFVGPCPTGMGACHDPDYCTTNDDLSNLKWGTQKQNMADCAKHGRIPRGQRRPNTKLTEEAVRSIRQEHASGTVTYVDLGRKYGVHPTTIRHVVIRKEWKHVS